MVYFSRQGCIFLAYQVLLVPRYFQWEGGLDGWRMMAIDDTATVLWTVAGAWEELERGGVAV